MLISELGLIFWQPITRGARSFTGTSTSAEQSTSQTVHAAHCQQN